MKRITIEYKMNVMMILLITTAILSTLGTTEADVRAIYDDMLNTSSYQMPLEIEDGIINPDAISKSNAPMEENIPDFCQCDDTGCNCLAAANVTKLWTLDQLLETLPNNISLLTLSGFTFGLLKNETFHDFTNLRRLFINNCSVHAIEVDAFKSFQYMDNIGLDLDMNNITSIIPGTFSHGRSWSFLSVNKNYDLGRDGVQTILHDLKNRRLNSLSIVACGIVIETLDKSFYKALTKSGLDRLEMHGNTIRTISEDAFEPVKSLTLLSISNFMYVAEDTFNMLTKLKFLKLGGMQASSLLLNMTLNLNNFQYLTQLRLNMFSLQPVNLEIGNITTLRLLRLVYANSNFDGYRRQVIRLLDTSSDLKSVDFSGNLLFQYSEEDLCQLLSGRKNLTSLSLTDNYISKLPLCTFRGLYKLQALLLKKNRLVSIQKDLFKDLHSLKHLDISENAITFIDASNFKQMTALSRLYLRENAFDCNCELRPFRDWLNQRLKKFKEKNFFMNFQGEMCFKPLSRKHEFVHNFTIPWIECNSGFVMTTSLVTIGSFLFCAVLTLVLLKHFWKDILYKKMIYKARKHDGYSPINDVPIEHDAFVSYHSEKQLWIERDLCTQLEDGEDIKFKLVFDDRMNPGESIFTSMGQAIHTSRKILFVASRGWVAAAMNQLEVDMALLKMVDDHRDMIIVLLMEHIPKAEMSEKLRMIIKHNTCFKWSDNERQQSKFWRDLKLELGKHHMD